jgi:hypothetical protein
MDKVMANIIGRILCSSIKNLFDNQPTIFEFTSETGETEWNLACHLSNEIREYIFWLNNDLELTKANHNYKRPDIVFHKRGIHALNFLVIELKHRGADTSEDIKRISEQWTRRTLRYRFGASIRIINNGDYNVNLIVGDESYTYNYETKYISSNNISSDVRNKLDGFVNKIFNIAEDDDYSGNPEKQAKVKRLEEEIDKLVYELYELTPEEIEIVEAFNTEK